MIDPFRTALLVVDMQYFDASPDEGEGRTAREMGVLHLFDDYFAQIDRITPVIADLLAAFRAKRMEVLHLRVAERTRDSRDVGFKQLVRGLIVPSDSIEAEFLPGLEPVGDEIVVSKSSSGVFAVTDLDRLLRNLGVDTLVFTGTSTGGCVQSAVYDATDLGYRVLVVEDACADSTDASHAACLARARAQAVEVVTAPDLLAALQQAPDVDPAMRSGLERVKPYLPQRAWLPNSGEEVDPYAAIFGPAIRQEVDAAALLLVDTHRLACDPAHRIEGLTPDDPGYVDRAARALDRMAELRAACATAGLPVLHVRSAGNLAGGRDLAPKRRALGMRVGADDPAAAFMPQVAPLSGEAVLNKPASSAFNGTGLDSLLSNLGVRTVILAGMSLNSSLEATMRSAGDRGYGIIVASDACAGHPVFEEQLLTAERGIINVRSVSDIAFTLAGKDTAIA